MKSITNPRISADIAIVLKNTPCDCRGQYLKRNGLPPLTQDIPLSVR